MRPLCVCCGAPLSGGDPTPVLVIQVVCDACVREIRELQLQTRRPATAHLPVRGGS